MSVYVDPALRHGGSSEFRWTVSCHMYADSLPELHAMAHAIGMKREWFQDHAKLQHYDLTTARRAKAVKRGAIEHTRAEMVGFMRGQRQMPTLISASEN